MVLPVLNIKWDKGEDIRANCRRKVALESWGLFLESPDNFSGPKSHS